MKQLIYGKGYLAKKYAAFLGAEISPLRVTDLEALTKELAEKTPDVVINCAGKTGKPNVDWCEYHKLETLQGNVTVPLLLADACMRQNVMFVHLSSGCIYDGNNNGKGFFEEDTPNYFGSFYSRTKMMAEAGLQELPVLVLRVRMPLDRVPDERNFITKIAKYKKVIDVPNSITVIDDLLKVTEELINRKATGVYNVTNPGVISHREILKLYEEIVDPTHTCEYISLDELHMMTVAKRSNCFLNTDKLAREGICMRPVREAVIDCLEKYKQQFKNNY